MLFAISGGEDVTIHEIQEAAKIITESIDKDAKVIFGTIRDEKLKKGELKVTVIATSFPADMPRKSLFAGPPTGEKVKEENAAVAKKEIHNSIQSNMGSSNNDFFKKPEKKEEEIIIEDDNDDWSAVPAFLRRKKN